MGPYAAAASRVSADAGAPVAIAEKARARPASVIAWAGAPQPSTTTALTASPDSSARTSRDRLLQRVFRVAVGRGRPAVDDAGREHRRVLARATLRQGRRRAALDQPTLALRGVRGQAWRVLQCGLGEPGAREDDLHALAVAGLARVRAGGQGQQLAVEVEAVAQHRDRLDELVGRPRQHRHVDVAGARDLARARRGRPRCRSAPTRRSRCARPGRRGLLSSASR